MMTFRIAGLAAAAFVAASATATMAEWNKMGPCDTMLDKYRDLPACVEDLNKQVKAMQLQHIVDEAANRLLKSYICNLALAAKRNEGEEAEMVRMVIADTCPKPNMKRPPKAK